MISELPWEFDIRTGQIIDSSWLHAMIAEGVGPDDAALIVRAVNAHDALVEACKSALARIESDISSTCTEALQLRAALEKAQP